MSRRDHWSPSRRSGARKNSPSRAKPQFFTERYLVKTEKSGITLVDNPEDWVLNDFNTLNVTYTSDIRSIVEWVDEHLVGGNRDALSGFKSVPYGLDIEWKPNTGPHEVNPPAVLQIAAYPNHVLLVQLKGANSGSSFSGDRRPRFEIPPIGTTFKLSKLLNILVGDSYTRVGAAVRADMELLAEFHDIAFGSTLNTVDLSVLAQRHYTLSLREALGSEVLQEYLKMQHWIGSAKNLSLLRSKLPFPDASLVDAIDNTEFDVEAIRLFISALGQIDQKTMTFKEEKVPDDLMKLRALYKGKKLILPIHPKTLRCGLEALADRYLGLTLRKSRAISCSNWEIYPLEDSQVIYCTLDASVSLHTYLRISERIEERAHLLTDADKKDLLQNFNIIVSSIS